MQKRRDYNDIDKLGNDKAILLEDMSGREDSESEEIEFKFFVDPSYYYTERGKVRWITPTASYVIGMPKGGGVALFASERSFNLTVVSEYSLSDINATLSEYIETIEQCAARKQESSGNQFDIREQLYVVKMPKQLADRALERGVLAKRFVELVEGAEFEYKTYVELLADNVNDQKCMPKKEGSCTLL